MRPSLKVIFTLCTLLCCAGVYSQDHELGYIDGNNIHFYFGTPCHSNQIIGYDTVFISVDSLVLDNYTDITYLPCFPLPPTNIYPSQLNDDYLFEDRFDGLYHIVIYDHFVTRKNLNVFFPSLPISVDFCGIDQILTHPTNGQVAVFKDSYNWINSNYKPIFNTNKELYTLWNISSGVMKFKIDVLHRATGQDLAFGHDSVTLKMNGVEMYSCQTTGINNGNVEENYQPTIYPNPSAEYFRVLLPNDQAFDLYVYNNVGQLISSEKNITRNEQVYHNLPNGPYKIMLVNEKKHYYRTLRLMIIR